MVAVEDRVRWRREWRGAGHGSSSRARVPGALGSRLTTHDGGRARDRSPRPGRGRGDDPDLPMARASLPAHRRTACRVLGPLHAGDDEQAACGRPWRAQRGVAAASHRSRGLYTGSGRAGGACRDTPAWARVEHRGDQESLRTLCRPIHQRRASAMPLSSGCSTEQGSDAPKPWHSTSAIMIPQCRRFASSAARGGKPACRMSGAGRQRHWRSGSLSASHRLPRTRQPRFLRVSGKAVPSPHCA